METEVKRERERISFCCVVCETYICDTFDIYIYISDRSREIVVDR